ncbi:hypothetical protein F751_3718 [Auxenochlorella protothecoides]|uniref:Uncharacterized protein n=1 Tax=Auxenochlorella protothecoides TaxID=3075 RepID=A0A087STP7_AUXPR|nr:hypothetical protein F751_3718 [Auxenochlorella protothecoides]KFM29101.1 hypothetical protein F751_3718 [Auxenochlorella protothecoides]
MLVLGAGKGQRNTGPSALTTPLGNAKAAAAGTVMEAQELGEQVRWLDDALYSLDGLRIRDASVQSASLLSLLELSARPATLAVMKQHGLLPLILETAGTWQFTASPTLKICAALFWAHYCAADLGPSGEPGALVSLERLASAPHSSASRLPSSLRRDAPALLLQALTERVEDQNDAAAALAWKEGLRCQGGFGIVAQTMLLCVGALTDTSPSEDTVRCLWTLHRSLVLFEAATFACPENAGEACAMQVTSRCTLLAWLVQMVATLASQGLRLGLKKDGGLDEGAKDLIVMYASILLGFVVMDDSSLRQHAEEILSDPGLRRPIQSIRLALRFYSGTGALMQENEQNLTALLQSLEAEP